MTRQERLFAILWFVGLAVGLAVVTVAVLGAG